MSKSNTGLSSSFALFLPLAFAVALAAGCKKDPAPGSSAQAVAGAAQERPKTREACAACNGVFQRHGLGEEEFCLCRTKDAGKVCRDASECQGQCIAGDADFEVVEAGPPALGYWKGRCSEFETTFGCNRTVGEGARKKKPATAEDAADTICID